MSEFTIVKRQQRWGEGVLKSEKWADIVYGWPLSEKTVELRIIIQGFVICKIDCFLLSNV